MVNSPGTPGRSHRGGAWEEGMVAGRFSYHMRKWGGWEKWERFSLVCQEPFFLIS